MYKKFKKRDVNYNLDDVLGEPPRGLSYYGSGLIFIVIVLLLMVSGFVKYPEIIQSEIYLTSDNPPRKLVSPISSYIDSIYIKDGSYIQKNEILLSFTNNSSKKDMNWFIQNIVNTKLENLIKSNIVLPNLQIASIQQAYDKFKTELENFRTDQKNLLYQIQINSIQKQLSINKQRILQISDNINLLSKKTNLSKSLLSTDSALNSHGVISKTIYTESQIKDINNGYQLNEEYKEKFTSELKIQTLSQELAELTINYNEQTRKSQNEIQILYNLVLSQFENWQNNFMIKSTVSGVVNFNSKHWVKGSFINQGAELLKITPKIAGNIIALVRIEDFGSSNVKIGQRVNVKLNNYPYKEYGILVGQVDKIITTPASDKYLIHVIFPKGLITSYGKVLIYNPQMKGKAEILTKKQSLLSKIFQEIKAIIYT